MCVVCNAHTRRRCATGRQRSIDYQHRAPCEKLQSVSQRDHCRFPKLNWPWNGCCCCCCCCCCPDCMPPKGAPPIMFGFWVNWYMLLASTGAVKAASSTSCDKKYVCFARGSTGHGIVEIWRSGRAAEANKTQNTKEPTSMILTALSVGSVHCRVWQT